MAGIVTESDLAPSDNAAGIDWRPMRVDVHRPTIDGETVRFSWEQSEPNPFQFVNSFFFRYEGIDLSQFTTPLFYEIFLGLQLKVFAAYETPVEVVFPEPIPAATAAFWQLFHHAEHVTISPLTTGGYSPWASDSPPPQKRRYGLLFGGGKDSTLATCLLREIYDEREIALFQVVVPLRTPRKLALQLEHRQEALMLQPARQHLGVATQRAWTDFVAQQFKSRGKLKPLIETYTVGLLPALLTWGIEFLTTSLPWSAFPFVDQPNGRRWFRWSDARPEMLAAQSAHYREVFGAEITLTNLNLLFTTFSAYRMLVERYPDPFTRITMCVAAEPDQRWCYHCSKCAEYALFGLALGIVDPRLDYQRLFTEARYVRRLVDYILGGVDLSIEGNAPWQPFIGSASTNHLVDCHVLSRLDPRLVADRAGSDGFNNLLTLKAAFGNTPFPYAEQVPASAVDLLGNETARRAAAIAADHLEVVEKLQGPFYAGNDPVEYDFAVRMPIEKGYGR